MTPTSSQVAISFRLALGAAQAHRNEWRGLANVEGSHTGGTSLKRYPSYTQFDYSIAGSSRVSKVFSWYARVEGRMATRDERQFEKKLAPPLGGILGKVLRPPLPVGIDASNCSKALARSTVGRLADGRLPDGLSCRAVLSEQSADDCRLFRV